jgi:hypothetical protein
MFKTPAGARLLAALMIFTAACRKEESVQTPFNVSFTSLYAVGGIADGWLVLSRSDGEVVAERQLAIDPSASTLQIEVLARGDEPFLDVTLALRSALLDSWSLHTWRSVASGTAFDANNPVDFLPSPPYRSTATPSITINIDGAPTLDSLYLPADFRNAPFGPGDPAVFSGHIEESSVGWLVRLREAGQSQLKSFWLPRDSIDSDFLINLAYGDFRADYPKQTLGLPAAGTRWNYKVLGIRSDNGQTLDYAVLDRRTEFFLIHPETNAVTVDVPAELQATTFQLWAADLEYEVDWRFAPGETAVPPIDFAVLSARLNREDGALVARAQTTGGPELDVLHLMFSSFTNSSNWVLTGSPVELEQYRLPRFSNELPFAGLFEPGAVSTRTKLERYENATFAHGRLEVALSGPYWRGQARYRARQKAF